MSEDKDLDALFDQEKLSSARKKAEETFLDFTTSEIIIFKRKLKSDLFFLATCLGYDLLSPNLHGNYANFIMKNRGWQYTLELMPRNHYKSSLRTIIDSIQMALPNEIGGSPVLNSYPYTLGPNIKLLLMHEVRDKASDFLFEIAQAFTRAEVMLAFFPECIPSRQLQRINRYELEIPRTDIHREATFETLGTGSASQGGHYHWIKPDDLFGEEARDSESTRAKLLRQFDGMSSLLTRPKFDGWNMVGTRWGFNDIYYHAMKRYGIDVPNSVLNCIPEKEVNKFKGGLLRVYARSIREKGEIIFPEEVTPERIALLRKNPIDFAAQHMNNPSESGITEFPWPLKFYNINARNPREIIVFSGDSDRPTIRVDQRDLDIVIFCDPSMGVNEHADETGIVVTGVDTRSNIFILETIKKRLIPPVLVDEIFRLFFKYSPRLIAIEEVNFSAIYKYWINERAKNTKVHLPIRAYKPGSQRSKEARIRGLSHFFSAGQVYVHEMMNDFRDEYEQFPVGESQHLLDALAQGPDYWEKGDMVTSGQVKNYAEKECEYIEARDINTGY